MDYKNRSYKKNIVKYKLFSSFFITLVTFFFVNSGENFKFYASFETLERGLFLRVTLNNLVRKK